MDALTLLRALVAGGLAAGGLVLAVVALFREGGLAALLMLSLGCAAGELVGPDPGELRDALGRLRKGRQGAGQGE